MSKYTVESSFLGHRTPKEVKLLLKALKTAKKETYDSSLDSAVEYIAHNRSPDFSKDLGPGRVLFGGFYCILTRAIRYSSILQQNHFTASLTELGFTAEVIERLGNVLFRDELRNAGRGPVENNSFVDIDWRLDVVLSNNSISKILQPEVLLDIKLSGKDDLTLQLSQSEFHALRQSAAKQLHDMCQLNERKFMNPS